MEQCLELNNRFCVRCLECISAPILEFSLRFKREIGARGNGCESWSPQRMRRGNLLRTGLRASGSMWQVRKQKGGGDSVERKLVSRKRQKGMEKRPSVPQGATWQEARGMAAGRAGRPVTS